MYVEHTHALRPTMCYQYKGGGGPKGEEKMLTISLLKRFVRPEWYTIKIFSTNFNECNPTRALYADVTEGGSTYSTRPHRK